MNVLLLGYCWKLKIRHRHQYKANHKFQKAQIAQIAISPRISYQMSNITANSSSAKPPTRKTVFDVQADEWAPFLIFLVIAAANSISLEGSYVIATSGFLKNLSVEQFPLLGMVDMATLLIVSGFYTMWIDRVSRLRFVQGLLIFLASSNFVFRFL